MESKLKQRADVQKLEKSLKRMEIGLKCFDTAEEAVDYLDGAIDGTTVGFGGSMTVQEIGLYPRLSAHNQTFWHWYGGDFADAAKADVYICSANGIAATGEIINIDGTGNRVAATVFGHRKVYFVAGINKLGEDYDKALWRARNVAAPKNALRFQKPTPCVKGGRCFNCASPERICRALTVLWDKPTSIEEMEVVLIDAELGY